MDEPVALLDCSADAGIERGVSAVGARLGSKMRRRYGTVLSRQGHIAFHGIHSRWEIASSLPVSAYSLIRRLFSCAIRASLSGRDSTWDV